MKKPTRIKQPAKQTAYVPQTRDECAEMINQIGRIQRDIAVTQAAMNDEIAVITDNYTGAITEQTKQLQLLQDGVQTFCETHRLELTDNGKTKTGGFVTGTVQWRQRPPSVRITGADSVIATLRRLGLGKFIRVKEEVNKDAILNEPAEVSGVAGIAIKSGDEDFVITPFEQELA